MTVTFEDWNETVFKKALASEKPVLLSISASWCHSCHEMDEQTYSHPEVASFLKENFVAVRVDTDQRPDINTRYNQGGWPSTVFLTPSGQILTGATFLPPRDFLEVSQQVLRIYRDLIIKGKITRILEREEDKPFTQEKISYEAKKSLFDNDKINYLTKFEIDVKERFDTLHGGFGTGQKFPFVDALRFCLKRYLKTEDNDLLHILTRSLEAYCEGGLFDHIEGGFFRYATERNFGNPHYEKILEDNLKLALLYYRAGHYLPESRYIEVSRLTLEFIKKWLFEDPFYYPSVDAVEPYYRIFSREEREKAEKPSVDKTIYTSINGLAASILSDLGKVEEAQNLVRSLYTNFRDSRGFFYHRKTEKEEPARLLSDQVYPLLALTKVFPQQSQTIGDFLRILLINYYDEENGGFYDRLREEFEVGLLRQRVKSLEENLILVDLLKKSGFKERAKKSLIEIFNLHREPSIHNAPLAVFLLSDTSV